MPYTVRSGDTLTSIASRLGTSVDTLARANGIRNKNLIFVGQKLKAAGSSPSAPASRPSSRPSSRPAPATHPQVAPAAGGTSTGRKALEWAKSVLGQNASYVKTNGPLGAVMPDWVPNNVNCANFVSATLIKAGAIKPSQASAAVRYLAANLRKDPNWSKVGIRDAKPGDVVTLRTSRGAEGHVVLFAGWKNGRPVYIGSNNVNADGSQRITYSQSRYPVTGVYTRRA